MKLARRCLVPVAAMTILGMLSAAMTGARAAAQNSAAAETAQGAGEQGGYPVRGTVVNRFTGQPVARALVVIDPDFAMLTDGNGGFAFERVPAGEHSLSVRRPGFQGIGSNRGVVHSFQLGHFAAQPLPAVKLMVGPEMPGLTVRIEPEANIRGQVTFSSGDAAQGIHISIFRRLIENGRPDWRMAGTATTRTDGSFHFDGLEAGNYMVYSNAATVQTDAAAGGDAPVWGYPPVYYPGVTNPAAAGILHLTPGEQSEADLTLARERFLPVTVYVRSTEQQFATFEVLDSGGHYAGFPVHYDAHKGIAHVNVPNGSWELISHGFGGRQSWGRVNFQVASVPVRFAMSLTPIPRIPVVIRRDYVSGEGNQTRRQGAGMNLFLMNSAVGQGGFYGMLLPVPGSNNRLWQVQVTQPGRFWVRANAFPPGYIASISSGGVDLTENPLTAGPGTEPRPIRVTLRDDTGTISGRVEGTPEANSTTPGELPQIQVYAIPLYPTVETLRQVSVQRDGSFTMANLPPGAYQVVACDEPQQIEYGTAKGLSAWSGLGQSVTLDAGGKLQITLQVTHGVPAP